MPRQLWKSAIFRVILLIIALPNSAVCSPFPNPQSKPVAREPYQHNLYALSKPLHAPKVLIDVSDAPETCGWAAQAQKLVGWWFPIVSQFLATENYTPPKTIMLVFKKKLEVPAYADGQTITIDAKWITAHPDDFGMIIHEMTHIIQHYPDKGDKPGWLVEGIADYIRFWRYEPDVPRPRVDPNKASYKDSYRTTAAFLGWVSGKYERSLVIKLDRKLRKGEYTDKLFEIITGRPLDELWEEYTKTLPAL